MKFIKLTMITGAVDELEEWVVWCRADLISVVEEPRVRPELEHYGCFISVTGQEATIGVKETAEQVLELIEGALAKPEA